MRRRRQSAGLHPAADHQATHPTPSPQCDKFSGCMQDGLVAFLASGDRFSLPMVVNWSRAQWERAMVRRGLHRNGDVGQIRCAGLCYFPIHNIGIILYLTLSLWISGVNLQPAHAHYIDEDFSGRIIFYEDRDFKDSSYAIKSDDNLPALPFLKAIKDCSSIKIPGGIWAVAHKGGVCLLGKGNYPNLSNAPCINVDDDKKPDVFYRNIENKCYWPKLRPDIMRRQNNDRHDINLVKSLNKRIAALEKALKQESARAAELVRQIDDLPAVLATDNTKFYEILKDRLIRDLQDISSPRPIAQ